MMVLQIAPFLSQLLDDAPILQLKSNHMSVINCSTLNFQQLSFDQASHHNIPFENTAKPLNIIDVSKKLSSINIINNDTDSTSIPKTINQHYNNCKNKINSLIRCRKCILPETHPMIHFDQNGICNYCLNPRELNKTDASSLEEILNPYRSNNGSADCIVALSGGRDSCFSLHYMKKILHMNPVAYSYDWGMLTDLARRNQARLCGKLGIEHIIVSADIIQKRKNIQKNVNAWLKSPDLGIIPLFMAGDKQYFYYANQIKKQSGIPLLIMGENPREKTNFKTGFCNVTEKKDGPSYVLSFYNTWALALYYLKNFASNPSYLNSSLIDTLGAFFSYYGEPRQYINLFQYIPWDEEQINAVLKNEYHWEKATDTQSTWRVGDATASFYNYIYYIMAGFTEHETFRSHQIREGTLTREQALNLVETENQPRYTSIKWYCDTIGIDWIKTLNIINAAPKRYTLLN